MPANRCCGRQSAAFAALSVAGSAACAQSSVAIYDSADQYVYHLRSSSGNDVAALVDGAVLRSRLGFRDREDLGGGLRARFQLEMGISTNNGTQAESTRGFDRQSRVRLGGSWCEVRLGRQNTALLNNGSAIDFTRRT
ncbi:porin [Comamonas thiooxydans]|uniref:porin n=1 Tax=Comamonas thiooxydans TaxID=363952 RepID=UPI00071104EA|nr:porin [Comamonas thiooxydans]